jgi:hypothetical protein
MIVRPRPTAGQNEPFVASPVPKYGRGLHDAKHHEALSEDLSA